MNLYLNLALVNGRRGVKRVSLGPHIPVPPGVSLITEIPQEILVT